jgi:hypothetical protein
MCVDGLTKQTEQAEGKDMVLLIDGCPHMAFFYRWLTIFYMLLLAICEHLSLAYSLSLSLMFSWGKMTMRVGCTT